MTTSELKKIAVKVRKGIITGTYHANPDIRADHYLLQTSLHICILTR